MEENNNIPKNCISCSQEHEKLLAEILVVNGRVMLSSNPLLNYLKSEVIELYYNCY